MMGSFPRGWLCAAREAQPVPECPWLSAEVWTQRSSGQAVCRVSAFGMVILEEAFPLAEACGLRWEERDAYMSKWVRQQLAAKDKKGIALSAEGAAWQEAHEALWEYMTCDELDGGGERMTSMLCILVEGGMVKGALQDRQEGLSLWAAAQSIPEVLAALEARLRAGDGDWRPMRGNQQRGGRNNRR